MPGSARRIGILAGGGSLPREIADSLAARDVAVKIVAIAGEADADFSGFDTSRVNWGQVGGLIDALRSAAVTDLVIIGRVRRPDLRRLTPDLGLIRHAPSILRVVAGGGDDSVLRRVVRFFEAQGFRVVGPADVAPQLVIGAGVFGRASPSDAARADIASGFAAVRILGAHDVGQAVIVAGGCIEAIEGAEGTDAMLARVAARRRTLGNGGSRGGVLVKRSKPGQELRVDLPAIGPDTVTRAIECGLSGIAVEAGRVLAAQRGELKARADAAQLFITGVQDAAPVSRGVHAPGGSLEQLNEIAPGKMEREAAAKGARVLADLAGIATARAVVVARGYVLGVEAGEGVEALIARVGSLRQWGAARTSRRIGVAVVAGSADVTAATIKAAAEAGLAGLAIAGGGLLRESMREAARMAGLALFSVAGASGGERDEATGDRADQGRP